ncbi:MAG: uncharacterized protein A8A55_1944 [Amphiamblys sp. WSBS2006]|nr:MAG: uncharacterized protein A8A55_1944 [Amphiamblys sp. WSBS2006]
MLDTKIETVLQENGFIFTTDAAAEFLVETECARNILCAYAARAKRSAVGKIFLEKTKGRKETFMRKTEVTGTNTVLWCLYNKEKFADPMELFIMNNFVAGFSVGKEREQREGIALCEIEKTKETHSVSCSNEKNTKRKKQQQKIDCFFKPKRSL